MFSCKNSSKPARAISNDAIPYIQVEFYTQTKQSYNYRLSLDDALRLRSAKHPIPVRLTNILAEPMIFQVKKTQTFLHMVNCSMLEKDDQF